MNLESFHFSEKILEARKALHRGDRLTARRIAEAVTLQAPELEEPWLILASLGTPQESVFYLKKALVANPHSSLARKGMHWAVTRLRSQDNSITEGNLQKNVDASLQTNHPDEPRVDPHPEIIENPSNVVDLVAKIESLPVLQIPVSATTARQPAVIPLLILIAIVIAGAWAVWPGNVLPAQAFRREKISHTQTPAILSVGLAGVRKPTYTPTSTPTETPTPTFTSTPTFTLTPTTTNTPLPTFTSPPTDTPFPTWTPIPQPTDPPGSGGERWIDVNLSEQRVYTYEGNSIVNSFLVSTGTWMYPTITGQYNIYVKYRYTDMAGPGYYLPDVPYTMYFYSGYALHGTYWHNNFGVPMSHGCVNLSIGDAGWLFDWASVGTLVNIHY
jgi:lipoprotein-anchoring transpeptidase ErfK/SrfK